MKVFVSYSRRDMDFALRIVEALRRWGHDPWIDIERISPGSDWIQILNNNGLKLADVMVGVLSDTSVESKMVLREWLYALENNIPLILVRLRACTTPYPFNSLQYIDFSTNESEGFAKLERVLQAPRAVDLESLLKTKPARTATIESAQERVTNRDTMLKKVQDFWIRGVLEPAKIGDVWLDLPAGQRPEAVIPEIKREVRNSDYDSFALGLDRKVIDVFQRMGNELLILGAPGSGKTITLLELARDLIAQAQTDDKQPIPVVFNLSSWAERHPNKLEDWLIERLFLDYNVPRRLGQYWIENGLLLFLFDGLDEVVMTQQDPCVTAINEFWRRYDQVDNGIAVCSRIVDYERLNTTLHLENAILLGSLTLAQADGYLAKLGDSWDELRAAIPNDTVLRTFAELPLLLNVMAVAYRDVQREEIIGLRETDQRRKLFNHYVARRLHEDVVPRKFPNTKTQHYLHWLATKMAVRGQAVFQIETLQPDWQDNTHLQRLGELVAALIVWVPIGSAIGLTIHSLHWTGPNFWGGLNNLLFGLTGGLAVWQAAHRSFKLVNSVSVGLLFGLALGLGFTRFYGASVGSVTGIIGGFIGGLAYRLIGTRLTRESSTMTGEIRTFEKVKLFPQNALVGFIVGLVAGLALGLFAALVIGLVKYNGRIEEFIQNGLLLGRLTGLAVGIPSALIFGLTVSEVGVKMTPNQGIWQSARNALYIGFGSGLASLFVTGAIPFDSSVFGSQVIGLFTWTDSLLARVFFGLASGLAVGFVFGGLTVVQHFLLRLFLCQQNNTPLNYAEFLDYCASRHLLRRVGGSYIFRHKMLMEYFAEWHERNAPANAEA